ncbi:MAG: CoA-binding protein [Gaiellales bacterium]|nr:MAG: CoA-binding protein [Gaiellales bacterium]
MDDPFFNRILTDASVIAVVGASPNPQRPSYQVASYLVEQGYTVVPVRPKVSEVMGLACYGSLAEVPGRVDIVDVFRRPEACPGIAREAVAKGARVLWLQQGIVSDEAARIAAGAGLEVVMDRCIKTVHQRIAGAGGGQPCG